MPLKYCSDRKARSIGDLNADYTQARREFAVLLPLGLGFLAGTALGAVAYITIGLLCVLLAVLPVGSMAAWYMRRLPGQATVASSAATLAEELSRNRCTFCPILRRMSQRARSLLASIESLYPELPLIE